MIPDDDDGFRRLLDSDVRGDASPEEHAELRSPAHRRRWLYELRRMQVRSAGTLEARDAEAEANRLEALLAGDDERALTIQRDHLRWRAASVRFKTGMLQQLLEAEWLHEDWRAAQPEAPTPASEM